MEEPLEVFRDCQLEVFVSFPPPYPPGLGARINLDEYRAHSVGSQFTVGVGLEVDRWRERIIKSIPVVHLHARWRPRQR